MIKDAQKRQFQFVLVYQLDRFARNRYDSATYKATLKKSGVRVISARENISDDASGVLMEAVLEGMAEYYSVELSQKIRRGMALNAEKGLVIGGQICLGYHVADKRFMRENESATANLVKAIEAGKAVDVISAQIEKRQLEHADLERQISKERISYPEVTLSQVRFFLTQFANGNIDDIKYRQALIDTFVNRIYLFDTDNGKNKKLTILCNTQDSQLSEITLSDLESSPKERLVEAGRIELPSENPSTRLSTSVSGGLTFPLPISLRQDIGFSSFINPARCKA